MTPGNGERSEAAASYREAARELARACRGLTRPADSRRVLSDLAGAQRSLEQALQALADWHRQTRPGLDYAEGRRGDGVAGVAAVVTELDLAVQQADGLRETLSRAERSSSVVTWFEEPEPDTESRSGGG